jgi:hypothetical protein
MDLTVYEAISADSEKVGRREFKQILPLFKSEIMFAFTEVIAAGIFSDTVAGGGHRGIGGDPVFPPCRGSRFGCEEFPDRIGISVIV